MPCILITVSGADHPGITAALTSILAQHQAVILDMEQVVVQERLSLSILIRGDRSSSSGTLKDLLFAAKEHGNDLDFRVLDPGTSRRQAHSPYVLTLLGDPELDAEAVSAISRVLATHGINIEKIEKLSERRFATLEMTIGIPGDADVRAVRAALLERAARLDVDVALQAEGLFRRAKRLVVFDLDSTLIRGEMLDLLGDRLGVGERIAGITRRAMRGEIDYATSLRERVALLKGTPIAEHEDLASPVQLRPRALELARPLHRLGFKTAIVSGGLLPVAEVLRRRLGVALVHANEVEVESGELTGRVLEPVLDAASKGRIVRDLATRNGITLDQVIAVGDGANDLPMLEAAGLGIAFHAHDTVQERARHVLNRTRLDSILFLLGISERDLQALQQEEVDAQP
ncbi:MAG: phosphoserine phosphatase SerB [Candidatus Krumholzibacteriia bacterium]